MILGLLILGIIFVGIAITYTIFFVEAIKACEKATPIVNSLNQFVPIGCKLDKAYMLGIVGLTGILGLIFLPLGIFLKNAKDISVSSDNTATQGGSRRSRK